MTTRRRGRPSRLDAPDLTKDVIEKLRTDLQSQLLTVLEASRIYDIPRQTLYRLMRGELKGHAS